MIQKERNGRGNIVYRGNTAIGVTYIFHSANDSTKDDTTNYIGIKVF